MSEDEIYTELDAQAVMNAESRAMSELTKELSYGEYCGIQAFDAYQLHCNLVAALKAREAEVEKLRADRSFQEERALNQAALLEQRDKRISELEAGIEWMAPYAINGIDNADFGDAEEEGAAWLRLSKIRGHDR